MDVPRDPPVWTNLLEERIVVLPTEPKPLDAAQLCERCARIPRTMCGVSFAMGALVRSLRYTTASPVVMSPRTASSMRRG